MSMLANFIRSPVVLLAALSFFLTGCATQTVRSDVTAFHEWPAQLAEKTFSFERNKEQDASLEYRNYENLVQAELVRLGFSPAATGSRGALKVNLSWQVTERDMRVVEPVMIHPGAWGPPYPYYYGPRWRGAYYGPFYDPFWYSPPVVQYRDNTYRVFNRDVKIGITRNSDNKRLFETTVRSEGQNPSLAKVMPYMIKSAFNEFPGQSGVPRRVDLPFTD